MKKIIIAICSLLAGPALAGPPAPGTTPGCTGPCTTKDGNPGQWGYTPKMRCHCRLIVSLPPDNGCDSSTQTCPGRPCSGDCTPPSEGDDAWIEDAIADGCEPIVEVDGEMEVECG